MLVRERPGDWTVQRSINENIDRHVKRPREGEEERTLRSPP